MKKGRIPVLVFLAILFATAVSAHTVGYDFSSMTNGAVGFAYLRMGFTHILPLGADHVLFVLGLFFLDPRMKAVIGQASAFTLAHSVTLGLAMAGKLQPPGSVIEPIIALSIVFLAVENIFFHDVRWWRVLVVFGFGLVHGCGFASALSEAGLPEKNFFLSLLSFNAGIELGQLTVILFAWIAVGRWFSGKPWYRRRIVVPVSMAIGCVALFWTIERTFS